MLWLQLIAMAESTQSCGDPQDRDIKVVYLAKYMDRWLYTYRHYNHNLAVRIRQKLSGETDGRVGRGGRERVGEERGEGERGEEEKAG